MKKIICFGIACAILMGFGFRVTKDHEYGIQTFENSKTGERGISFDGGNTWHKTHSTSAYSSYSSSSKSDSSSWTDEYLDKGCVYVIKDGSAKMIKDSFTARRAGRLFNLKAKLETGSMEIDWSNQQKYVYVSNADDLKEFDSEVFEIFKISSRITAYLLKNGFLIDPKIDDCKQVFLTKGFLVRMNKLAADLHMKPSASKNAVDEEIKNNDKSDMKYIAPKMFAAEMQKMQKVKWDNCECEIDTYYNYEFEECKKTHWSISIFARPNDGGSGTSFYGYVLKASSAGKKISSILSDGKEHKLGLVVRYTDKAESERVVEIVDCFEK